MYEAEMFKEIATGALQRCNTVNDLQYLLGYITADSTLPLPSGFLHTRHWAIVFYVSCVLKIVETKLDFVYPDNNGAIALGNSGTSKVVPSILT
jgi:hypothetical protein